MMMRYARVSFTVCVFVILLNVSAMAQKPHVVVEGDHFYMEGGPRFLIFVSYFDAMRARRNGPCVNINDTSLQCDFKYIKEILRFDGVRIFVNWWMYLDVANPANPGDNWHWNDTLFEYTGNLRPGKLDELKTVLDAAGAAGLVVDLTFTRETVCGVAPRRGGDCPDDQRMSFANYKNAVVTTVSALANESERFSHVIVDLQNEHDLSGPERQFQFLDLGQVAELVNSIRAVGGPISRRLGASTGMPTGEVAREVAAAQLNIADWHDPRDTGWYSSTESRVVEIRASLSQFGITVPIFLDEPQRWQDDGNVEHMKIAAQGAKRGGAAAWTFHTRTAFNLNDSSFRRRLEFDPPQAPAMEQLRGAADAVSWAANLRRIIIADAPQNFQTVSQPFMLGGWAIDERAASGPGVDTVHVWAYPAGGGNPIFCGASYGGPRPDIAAAYGQRFANSGYSMLVRGLPQGVYNFVAYAHSTFSGIFDNTRVISNVSVQSAPILVVDFPGPNATVLHTFNLLGWAIDFASSSGTGVDTVHVWAYPASGGPAQFVGVAGYGADRPDVGAIYGPQFTNSGYYLTINSLPAGTWDLALFPHSTLNNNFFPATVRRVTVLP